MNRTQSNSQDINASVVLELQRVTQHPNVESSLGIRDLDLILKSGELLTIQVEPSTRTRSFASMIQGITEPDQGKVFFLRQEWSGVDYHRQFANRGLIGRVFEGQAWIENLNLDENVTLACRHHGRSKQDIQESTQSWLNHLGLEKLTTRRPAFVAPATLQLHQWIRAFMACPKLVLLERPLDFLDSSWIKKLLDAIQLGMQSGAGVLWLDSRRDLESLGSGFSHRHLRANAGILSSPSILEGI